VSLDCIGKGVAVSGPDVLHEHGPRQDNADVSKEIFQKIAAQPIDSGRRRLPCSTLLSRIAGTPHKHVAHTRVMPCSAEESWVKSKAHLKLPAHFTSARLHWTAVDA